MLGATEAARWCPPGPGVIARRDDTEVAMEGVCCKIPGVVERCRLREVVR